MPTVSTVVATKQALVALLAAREGLADVAVEYAWREGLGAESITLGNPESDQRPSNMRTGRLHRDEEYLLPVYVVVDSPGGTVEGAEERVVLLAAEVEDALADDKKIGSLLWSRIESYELASGLTENGVAASVTLRVRCHARLI